MREDEGFWSNYGNKLSNTTKCMSKLVREGKNLTWGGIHVGIKKKREIVYSFKNKKMKMLVH